MNKGDFDTPKIRSRLVGKEFRTGLGDPLYASTLPLEALRVLLSRAALADAGKGKREITEFCRQFNPASPSKRPSPKSQKVYT